MKKFYILTLIVALFAACTNDTTEDLSLSAPGTLRVSFDNQSRVELDYSCQTVWTKGDKVSVFHNSDSNDCYQYQGETGEREGILLRTAQGSATTTANKVVVVYPYNENYTISHAESSVDVTIPAVQYYKSGSYGVGANLMVATGTGDNFSLKSLCGWVRLQFKGSEKLTKITLRGNEDEQIAGSATANYDNYTLALIAANLGSSADGEVGGTLVTEEEYATEITLDLGEGVQLTETPTDFYFTLAPQTFTKGITVTATADNGTYMTQTTDKEITISCNAIQPMAAVDYVGKVDIDPTAIPDNEIWYTTTDGNIIGNTWIPIYLGVNIISNTYVNGKGVIKTDGNITKIGECAFQNCSNLASITIPNSVTTIEDSAFSGCDSLSDITIPNSVTKIGGFAFYDCSNLISITIPNSVTNIETEAFENCNRLTSITIPDSVTEIGVNPFRSCGNLAEFKGKFASKDGRCLIIDGVLNSFAPARLTEYTIPSGVITIGNSALYHCTHLTNVTIPDSVTNIEDYAFCGCTHLLSIIIPEGVTTIGKAAFSGCNSLVDIIIPESVTTIESSAFYIDNYSYSGSDSKIENVHINNLSAWCNISFEKGYESFPWSNPLCDAENLYLNGELITDLIIPNDVTEIKTFAFYDCESLTSVTIPDNVISIGMDAFYYCSNITSVTIGNGVTEIGFDAFRFCNDLKSITIGNNVTLIMDRAFYDCKKLTSVTIPKKVTYIGWNTFYGCENLESIYCLCTTPPQIGYDTFDRNANNRKIYVPRASLDAYKTDENWSYYTDSIEPYDF